MNAPIGAITASAASTTLALLVLIAGCASQHPAPRATSASEPRPAPTNPIARVFADRRAGLEVQWWTVTARDDALAQALAPYADEPTPLPPTVRANWRRNGLRMVRVPFADMNALLTALPIEDKVNQTWIGQSPRWTVAAPGAPWNGRRSLLIDGETIRLGAGRLRLLVRAWISPTEGPPTLRTDLALQYLNSSLSAPSRTPFDLASLRRPETDGMIFRTLTAAMEISGEYAYCIVSEDPDIDWATMRSAGTADGEGDRGVGDSARQRQAPTLPEHAPPPFPARAPDDQTRALGPKPPGIPLLADALLSRVDLLPTRRRARSIVILAPIVPETFRLAPTAAADASNPDPANTPR